MTEPSSTADLERGAGPGGEIAVAGAVDEHAPEHGAAAGFGLDEQGGDLPVGGFDDAGAQGVEQDFHAGFHQQGVGGDLVGGGVIGLGVDFPEYRVRCLQSAEGVDAAQQVIGETVHDLVDGAEPVGMQAAEIGDAGGGAHAAEEAVALHQQGRGARSRGGSGGGDPGWPAAQDDDVERAEDLGCAGGFGQVHGGFPQALS